MAPVDEFDKAIEQLVDSNRLSASKVKNVTDLAVAAVANDAHLVSTMLKVIRKAKPAHKLSAFYILDAISRECRQIVKKGKARDLGDSGSCASLLTKIEAFLDKLVEEVWEKGLPEHRPKIKKVVDIWVKTATFSASAASRLESKMSNTASAPHHSNSAPGSPIAPTVEYSSFSSRQPVSTTPPGTPPRYLVEGHSSYKTTATRKTSASGGISDGQAALLAYLGNQKTPGVAKPDNVPEQTVSSAPEINSSQLAILQQLAAKGILMGNNSPIPPTPQSNHSTATPPPNIPPPPQPPSGFGLEGMPMAPAPAYKPVPVSSSLQNQHSTSSSTSQPGFSNAAPKAPSSTATAPSSEEFDFTKFNATEAASWAAFAETFQKMFGYTPSNQQVVMWTMQSMGMPLPAIQMMMQSMGGQMP